jgi:trk system potassium uptake protein TrkA
VKKEVTEVLNIIVVGCGTVGQSLVEQLVAEGHDITIIDTKESPIQEISSSHDTMGIIGSGASMSTLSEAGVATADLLISVTESDELNMLCCTLARKTNKNIATIARVRNPEYANELPYLRQQLGISMIINPELEAAEEIARLLSHPQARHVSSFARGGAELVRFRIPKGNILCGKKLYQTKDLFPFNCLFGAVEREDQIHIPDGSFVLQEGDDITIIASSRDSSRIFEVLDMPGEAVESCIIVGGSIASFYLANLLETQRIRVKVIEKSRSRCQQLSSLLPNTTILCGDATAEVVLKECGVEDVEAFVSLSTDDEDNILLTLYAQKIPGMKTITRINRTTFTNVIADLNLGSVVYPKRLASEQILAYVRARQNSIGSNVETLYNMFDNRVEALEFHINPGCPLIGIPLMKLQLKSELLVVCIGRNGKVIFPRGNDVILAEDTVTVITTHTGFHDISDILA